MGEFGQATGSTNGKDLRQMFPRLTPMLRNSSIQRIPIQPIHVFGVAKAYDTKVGTHTFLTQVDEPHPLFDRLKKARVWDLHRKTKKGWMV